MKLDITKLDPSQFIIVPDHSLGETLYLVIPQHMGTEWNNHNLHLRSSIWNGNGELVSASFPKFFNWGEKPDLTYTPFSLTANGGCNLMTKIDGSTMILSKYKNNLIVRTRGTHNARKMDKNGHEIDQFIIQYPKVFNSPLLDQGYSLICEWVSPLNRIVIKYDQPDIYLIGCIKHDDYSLMTQNKLDELAKEYDIKRPQRYTFNSINDMIAAVEAFKGVEGICVYCNKDQNIRKLKGIHYLHVHRMKSELDNIEHVIDMYITTGRKNYNEFYQIICDTVDYEIATMIMGDISNVVEANKEVENIISHMKIVANELKSIPRKNAAEQILQKYGNTNRSAMAFTILDGKELDGKQLKKLFFQLLKK